jgi:hypothetical protein
MVSSATRCSLTLLVQLLLVMIEAVSAQSPDKRPDQPACSACRIEAVLVSRIRGAALVRDSSVWWPAGMARDSNGNYILVRSEPREAAPMVFDPRGRKIGNIGQVGTAPGQYKRPFLVWRDSDGSIHLADNALHRHTTLDGGQRYTRASPLLPGVTAAVTTSSGNLLVSRREPGNFRSVTQLLSPSGRVLRTFRYGSASASFQSAPSDLARASDGSFVAVRKTHEYQIARWAESGELIEIIAPVREWFPPYSTFVPPEGPGPPTPAIAGIWLDASRSLLWIFGVTSDTSLTKPATRPSPMRYEERLDGIIDVFDLRNFTLLASGRFNSPFFLVSNDGLVASFDASPPEGPTVNIFEVKLNSLPR